VKGRGEAAPLRKAILKTPRKGGDETRIPVAVVLGPLLIGVPVGWGIWKWRHNGALVAAMIVLLIFWALVLALLEWAGRSDGNPNRARYGFIDVVIGADGRVSTSQTVVYSGLAFLRPR
jgi:hypothetical protein